MYPLLPSALTPILHHIQPSVEPHMLRCPFYPVTPPAAMLHRKPPSAGHAVTAANLFYLGAAILTEYSVYDNRHCSVRPATLSIDHSVTQLFISQHDVSFELATPFPRILQFRDICNKTYGNLL